MPPNLLTPIYPLIVGWDSKDRYLRHHSSFILYFTLIHFVCILYLSLPCYLFLSLCLLLISFLPPFLLVILLIFVVYSPKRLLPLPLSLIMNANSLANTQHSLLFLFILKLLPLKRYYFILTRISTLVELFFFHLCSHLSSSSAAMSPSSSPIPPPSCW